MRLFFSVFLVYFLTVSSLASGAQEDLRYRCVTGGSKVDLILKTTTGFLHADLGDDVTVKGFASETVDRKNGTTYYFLQGGSEPYSERLTLTIRENGKWARFTRAVGANEFVCEFLNQPK